MTPRKNESHEEYRARQREWDRLHRDRRKPQIGPSGRFGESPEPHVGEGLQLKGQSVLVSPNGGFGGRWDKSRAAPPDTPAFDPVPPRFAIEKISSFISGPDNAVQGQWVSVRPEKAKLWDDIRAACKEAMAEYRGVALPTKAPKATDSDLLAFYPLGDPHLGLMSWAPETGQNFDLKIATTELIECLRQLVAGTPKAKRAVLVNLGDFLHAQDDDQLTPQHKHKLDVDGRRNKVLLAAHLALRSLVDLLLARHEQVEFVSLAGNHDPLVAFELAHWIAAVYEMESRVTVADAFSPYWFELFGNVLLGAHHGNQVKLEDYQGIMSVDAAKEWGLATHRYMHLGHVHHRVALEKHGCVIECHNTLAASDAHHHGRGYRSSRNLKSIVYHKRWGEFARFTVGIDRVRAALEGYA